MAARTPTRTPWHTARLGRTSFKLDRRVPLVAAVLLFFSLVVLVFSISYGQYTMTPLDVVQTLLGLNAAHPDVANFRLVVFTFRLPRIVLAFLVGVALGAAGSILQGVTRNPLAEPGLLGVSAGAGLAAVALIVLYRDVPIAWLPWATFTGALLTATTNYLLAWRGGGSSPVRLVLVGVALASVLGAATSTLLLYGRISDVRQATVWLTGSVYGRDWGHVRALAAWLAVLVPAALVLARPLNLLTLGEDTARSLGLRLEVSRALLLLVSVALTAAAVAVSGAVGFVGLIAPHVARGLVGPSQEGALPVAMLFGGALMVLADLVGRWIIAPSELPVGVVIALLGAPFFAYLLVRNRNR